MLIKILAETLIFLKFRNLMKFVQISELPLKYSKQNYIQIV